MAKTVVDLTNGGKCEACDTELICSVCEAPYPSDQLFYAPSGDHDHLVMRNGALGREAHGRFLCAQHFKEDWILMYPGHEWPKEADTKTPEP